LNIKNQTKNTEFPKKVYGIKYSRRIVSFSSIFQGKLPLIGSIVHLISLQQYLKNLSSILQNKFAIFLKIHYGIGHVPYIVDRVES
jgi:hypothetical protein